MNLEVYDSSVYVETFGLPATIAGEPLRDIVPVERISSPLTKAFLDDDDYQEMTLISSSLLLGRRIRKIYRTRRAPAPTK